MSWTDDRVDVLRKLWADGLSASQIAAELGGVTRNAVIGKVHRLGLSGRAKNPSTAANRKKRVSNRASGYSKSNNRGQRAGGSASAVSRQPIVIDIPKPKLLNLNLLQLNDSTCKWPVGDPQDDDFAFCGNKPREGDPYCEYHCRLAYQPAADRRRGGQRQPIQTRISAPRATS